MKAEMDDLTKELVAIGASIGAHCQPCLTYHVGKARELGIDADLIRAAVEVGNMVEKGSMAAMREFAKGALAGTSPAAPVDASCCGGKTSKGGKCCCG